MIRLGPEQCRRIEEALTREWLAPNGLGGYASATAPGTPTRAFHGLLVARLPQPVGLAVMLAQCDEMLTYEGRPYQISTTEYQDGTLAPTGYVHLAEFRLERHLPVTVYEIDDTTLEKRVWMAYGQNTTYIQYRLSATARETAELRLRPLVNGRVVGALRQGDAGRALPVTEAEIGCDLRLDDLATDLRLRLPGGWFESRPDWYWRVLYRRTREAGYDYVEDLFSPGTLAVRLRPGQTATLIVSNEALEKVEQDGDVAWQLEWRRRGQLLERATLAPDDGFGRALTLAADAFLPHDRAADRPVVTSYHWREGACRDMLIGLPGLTLATGRMAEGRAILAWLVERCRDGLLPAHAGPGADDLDYASADTTLWFFVALRAYLERGGDARLLDEIWERLKGIIAAHVEGTRFGIHVDQTDGLLWAGEMGQQLTWMDAKAGDWVVTPRRGKPVEINALWHNALRQMAVWAREREPGRAEAYDRAAEWVESSFNRRYWYAPGGYLYDVIDTDGGDDVSLRPNQILAISLPFPVLARDRWRPVLDTVTDHLLTPVGLRTLTPGDPRYIGWYAGDAIHRDSAYHQGTVVPWLIGPYLDAYLLVYRDRSTARERLLGFEKTMNVAGLGSISEIFDGDAPHSPQGCVAQATAVAEALRLWRVVQDREPDAT